MGLTRRGFDSEWLALREPLDCRARSSRLAARVAAFAAARTGGQRLTVVDLGAGTGANLRYAAPLIGGTQDWWLLDRDALLLAAAEAALRDWAARTGAVIDGSPQRLHVRGRSFECRVHRVVADLAATLDALPLAPPVLLCASALLDLVSEQWLQRLIARAAAAGAVLWFALSYDGRQRWQPADREDAALLRLFNRHQRSDKGFGAALGPRSRPALERLCRAHGYRIECAASDWQVPPEARVLQSAMLEGCLQAALEIAPRRAGALHAWAARRGDCIEQGESRLLVGHYDMVGLPPQR